MTPTAVLNIRKEPYYRREAFEKGLKRLGYTIGNASAPKNRDDLLCCWNLKRGAEENAAKQWEAKGGTVIVVENGYLQKVDKTRYAISTHGHNGSGWFPMGNDERFWKLGFEMGPWRSGGIDSEILVRAQRGIGSTLMASPPGWAEKKVTELRRTHPAVRLIPHPGNFAPKVPVEKDLERAITLHIWCSAMGVRALVEGIPVIYHAPHWVCEFYMNEGRSASLQRMAHGQWGVDEIATGEPFARMKAEGWGPTWR